MSPSAAELSQSRGRRLDAVRAAMAAAGVEALCCSLGADLPWLCGYEAMPLERPTLLVVPLESRPTLLVPALEAPRVRPDPEHFDLRPWKESEDPIALAATLLGTARELAISDRAWSALLLQLMAALPGARFRVASAITGPLRAAKDEVELAVLAAASAAADRVAAALVAGEIPLVGRSESAVSRELSERLLAEGHERVNFAIVGSGPNSASPHHEASQRTIGPGEAVVCDFGGTFRLGESDPYCSDITRTVVTDHVPEGFGELYGVLERAQAAAVAAVATGRRAEEIDAVAREEITAAGYGEWFIHRTGHGIGLEEHEEPYIAPGNATLLAAGHAFSVEPGIYLGGEMGARIEDIVAIFAEGPRALNRVTHSLVILA